ncbi:hypothetical protein HN587_01675 [Candidatus Woesearchaeota archaeon]|jgi:hypothetical protein|nr:hypothetical protein [Candidatus Woesearchaeota archaeon]
MSVEKIIEKTRDYLAVPAVVGHEQRFLDHLHAQSLITQYRHRNIWLEGDLGNKLLVLAPKNPSDIILSVHVDRLGIVVNERGEFEYANFHQNPVKAQKTSEAIFQKSGERFVGQTVVAYDPKTEDNFGTGMVTGFDLDY